MNCIDFRRICIALPAELDSDCLAHKRDCAGCATLAEEMGLLDQHLKQAVAVKPPAGLAARLLLRQSLSNEKRSRKQFYFAYAIAASLFLALTLTITLWQRQATALDEEVMAYIVDDPAPRSSAITVQTGQLQHLFESVGMTLNGDLGTVIYAQRCYIRGQLSLHLVLAGSNGPVTVILMPEQLLEESIPIRHTTLNGIIVPCPKGSMAIVGVPGEPLQQIETKMRKEVIWI